MRQLQRSLIILGMLAVLALLAGCGSNIPTSATNPPATPTTTVPSSTTSTPTPTTKTGPVKLQAGATFYQSSQTITVTLSNQSSQTIYFPDHLTNCTVILLQRSQAQPQVSGNGQTGINPCPLGIITRIHSLGPGQHLVVRLVAPKNGWPVGLYLATLSYRTSPTIGPSTTISSAAFAVGSPAPQP